MIELITRLFSKSEPVLSETTSRDAAAIAKLHAASFNRGWSEDEIERLMLERNVLTHRVTVNGRLVGFIMSRMAGGEAEILSTAVAAPYRKRGLARRMLNHHMGRLSGIGVRVIFLEVDEANAAARQLYHRAGFVEAGRREGYYSASVGKPATALVLRRDLA
jgi:[ribosomal protein S18]-alanine N-acetyltransferase